MAQMHYHSFLSKATNEESYLMQKLADKLLALLTLITVQDIAKRPQQKPFIARRTAVTQVLKI